MSKRAFTLIELLVVIAIIAILAAILFPVFAQAKASAKKASRLSDMKQMATGLNIYSADYDDVCVRAWWDWIGGPNNEAIHWPQRVYPYVKNSQLYIDKVGNPQPYPKDMTVTANFAAGPNMAMNWHAGDSVPMTAAERPSQLIILSEAGVRDWFGNGSLLRSASTLNPWDWRDIWGTGMGVQDGARRSIRCVNYEKLGSPWMMNHYDPQIPWSIDWRHIDGANFPHMDSSAKYYRRGTLKPENFYIGNIPSYAYDGRNNCDF